MTDLRRAQLRDALDLVGMVAADTGPDPFSRAALSRLQEMTDADSAVGYVEARTTRAAESYQLVTRRGPTWMFPILDRVGQQDPIHAAHCRDLTAPVAISDRISAREFQRLDIYRLVCEPLGVADSIRIYLPAPAGCARYFFFDRSRRGFSPGVRTLLELLQPHLAGARARRGDDHSALSADQLTPREAVVMRWVAAGACNAQIARQLWVSEHTVRKHLENVFAKLGVHSRTAAVAALRDRTAQPPPAG
ncbi:MAG: helix-turn-helix transcriptional regulator [Sciscionella sp.]